MNLQEDINRHKELMNIVTLSDLNKAGTWSPNALVRAKNGRQIYTYDNGQFVKRDKEPNERAPWSFGYKPKDVFYLTSEEAYMINQMIVRARELEAEAKKLRADIKDIIGTNKKFK